ncbi:MAG: hypothetical protein V1491_02270 [archaeon]
MNNLGRANWSLIGIVLVILMMVFVLADIPEWVGDEVNYTTSEDVVYYHNLSANITGFNNDVIFAINTLQTDIYWTNASGRFQTTEEIISNWIKIYNSTTGNLTLNATYDNQTGFFEIPLQATNITDSKSGTVPFYFMINATNDFPEFSNLNVTYNLSSGENFNEYVNATDEEEHYPLFFNVSFLSNCTHALWSGRNDNENCSIFNLTNVSDTSTSIDFMPGLNDAGVYWANVSVMDAAMNYNCTSGYCEVGYNETNKTTYQIVEFNVLSSLTVNVSNCTGQTLTENEAFICYVNITTKSPEDELNTSSLAFLNNSDVPYQVGGETYIVYNASWFYGFNQTNSSNYMRTIQINVTPQKEEIGNWTINFTAEDRTSGEPTRTESIYLYVTRNASLNDAPELGSLSDVTTSVLKGEEINLSVIDDDLVIPDKQDGYNETTTFTYEILNRSNLSQSISFSNFNLTTLYMPVISGGKLTNETTAKINFTANSSEGGNYTINVNATDVNGSVSSRIFNLTILPNNFPYWNQETYQFNLTVNSTLGTTSAFSLNLTNLTGEAWANDSDGDTLSFTNTTAFQNFNLTSAGIISFTPWKQDVGIWEFNITANDGYLSNTTSFIFNISNINSAPFVDRSQLYSGDANALVDFSKLNVTTQEGNYTRLYIYIYDNDFLIINKTAYNESLSIVTTITNISVVVEAINFSFDYQSSACGDNCTIYLANFTPENNNMGNYTVNINSTDESNSSNWTTLNLVINSFDDSPILMNLTNQTSVVNRSLYYNINATDEEDGNDTVGVLNFSYNFISGTDFINDNETIFNTTSGILNITFNQSYAGKYHLNITVNDSSSNTDSGDFWIYVYDFPNVTFPSLSNNFSLSENVTSNLTFTVNHSVGDNLTYEFYIDEVLRYNLSYYGNGTNLTWEFTPNFTDETYGNFTNLTLITYPSSFNLTNRTELNTTTNWSVNISYTNFPVNFTETIDNQLGYYNAVITINLSEHFSDIDHEDNYYNQTVNFTISSNSSSSIICSPYASVSSDWMLTLPAPGGVTVEILNITAIDYNSTNSSLSNVTSNNFTVTFTTPSTTTVETPSSGGSGGSSTIIKYYSLKIIFPNGDVMIHEEPHIQIPLLIKNEGLTALRGINLTSEISFNNEWTEDVSVSFAEDYIDELLLGESKNITMDIYANTDRSGKYKASIFANVSSPKFSDWASFYIYLNKTNVTEVESRIIFTEKFVAENPQCIELTEVVEESKELFKQGRIDEALKKSEEVITACKNSIASNENLNWGESVMGSIFYYLSFSILFVLVLGVIIYIYKRVKLTKPQEEDYI